jgi:uncharacterized RDD family membrane protein YckC
MLTKEQEIIQTMNCNQVLYATLPRRIKASIIDGVVLMALFILCPLAIGTMTGSETGLNAIAMYTPPLLLEPFLISYLGFTLGQYIFGIQVIRLDNGEKCPLVASFARYYTKLLLGSLSMVYMLFSKKHQAIHDHVAKTLVVLSHKKIEQNPEFAIYGEKEQDFENDVTFAYPSILRRFVFFCIWIVVASIAFGILFEGAALLILPGYTLDTDKMPKQIEVAANLLYSIMFISLAVFASKGYLPGAKRKKKEIEVVQEKPIGKDWF